MKGHTDLSVEHALLDIAIIFKMSNLLAIRQVPWPFTSMAPNLLRVKPYQDL